MPTYAYACTVCGHQFEIQQSFTDESLTVCPECSGRLRKLFSSVGVVFKGSGFYRNDARAGGSQTGTKPAASGASGASTPSSDSSSGSSSSTSSPAASSSSSGSPSSTTSAPAASA
ncbi:FmdB family zinc ribbon protein [Cellulomonas massiliensis]|uniref:FmdB family zinc ribbon protein n=1 Tax=Cellulomonas massiliensis TaxID=1465811 RepID=UPI0002FC1188|nr:FmdB family zinc ribbon protein [Cellulomonas massiliensis]